MSNVTADFRCFSVTLDSSPCNGNPSTFHYISLFKIHFDIYLLENSCTQVECLNWQLSWLWVHIKGHRWSTHMFLWHSKPKTQLIEQNKSKSKGGKKEKIYDKNPKHTHMHKHMHIHTSTNTAHKCKLCWWISGDAVWMMGCASLEGEVTATWADDTGVFSRTADMDVPVSMGTLSQKTLVFLYSPHHPAETGLLLPQSGPSLGLPGQAFSSVAGTPPWLHACPSGPHRPCPTGHGRKPPHLQNICLTHSLAAIAASLPKKKKIAY